MLLNTPEIKTQRLILRRFTLKDAKVFFSLVSDKEVNTFLPFFPFKTIKEASGYLQENYLKNYKNSVGFRYAVCLKSDNIPIGYVNISEDDSYDLGYALKKEFWHKGIITEACEAVIKQVKKAGMPYITATHDIDNPKSGNVMKRLGMTYCYSYKEQWQPKNIFATFRMYQLNFNKQNNFVYQKYWDTYPVHFIEKNI